MLPPGRAGTTLSIVFTGLPLAQGSAEGVPEVFLLYNVTSNGMLTPMYPADFMNIYVDEGVLVNTRKESCVLCDVMSCQWYVEVS